MTRDMGAGAGELVMLVGPSGCGKTAWWAGRFLAHQVLSLDRYRQQLTDDAADQSVNPIAVELRGRFLEHRLRLGLATVIDSTNTVLEHRGPLLAAARRWHRPTAAVVFHTPLAICQARQHDRDRMDAPGWPAGRATPPEVVARMWHNVAGVWDRMALEVDCVVHVSPDGMLEYAVGDIPRAAGVRCPWIEHIPTVPSVRELPWASPYTAAAAR